MLKKIFLIIISSVIIINNSFAQNNIYIYASINENIITNFDILKESEYLKILNPNLEKLNKEKIFQLSKESLIKEIIKKSEISKILDLNTENDYVEDHFKNLYTRLNFVNENEFKSYLLSSSNYSIEEIKQKLKIEIMWNELIYSKYKNQVKIDKKNLSIKIDNLSDKIINEYQLSEIVFKNKKGEILNNQIKSIVSSINEIGFENTANVYSISDSSKMGGKIGWINESNLSEAVSIKLKSLKEGQFSEVIQIGNNFLILKVEKIRKIKISINKDDELNKMIKYETNKQLNQFSKIFFDKSKINYSINEK